jgi:hypothetical protein
VLRALAWPLNGDVRHYETHRRIGGMDCWPQCRLVGFRLHHWRLGSQSSILEPRHSRGDSEFSAWLGSGIVVSWKSTVPYDGAQQLTLGGLPVRHLSYSLSVEKGPLFRGQCKCLTSASRRTFASGLRPLARPLMRDVRAHVRTSTQLVAR